MRVEILHERDPDYSCTVRVFVNGYELDQGSNGMAASDTGGLAFQLAGSILGGGIEVHVEDIDPGAGSTFEDWAETTKAIQDSTVLTPAFRDAVVALRDEVCENSKYIADPIVDEEEVFEPCEGCPRTERGCCMGCEFPY